MPRKKVRVDVFDADGCIFNSKAQQIKRQQAGKEEHSFQFDYIGAGNTELFNLIAEQITNNTPDAINVMCGSNRQSFHLDRFNSLRNDTDLFFPVLNKIVDILGCFHSNVSLEPILLADIFCQYEPGSAFLKAITPSEAMHLGCPFDDSKIILIYTLLQHAANKHGHDVDLDVHFYDDRMDILTGLNDWMSNNLDLIPSNITFNSYCYNGERLMKLSEPLHGEGEIDESYPETAQILAYLGGLSPLHNWLRQSSSYLPPITLNPKNVRLDVISDLRSDWESILKPNLWAIDSESDSNSENDTDTSVSHVVRNQRTNASIADQYLNHSFFSSLYLGREQEQDDDQTDSYLADDAFDANPIFPQNYG